MGKDIYEEKIKPRQKDIKVWLEEGFTQKQIAEKLEISYSSFRRAKDCHKDLQKLIISCRNKNVEKLEHTALEAACGFKKVIKKPIKVKTVEYYNGKREKETETIEYVEEETYYPPNATMLIFLLKNWGKGYANDPEYMKHKKKELELRKEQIEKDDGW